MRLVIVLTFSRILLNADFVDECLYKNLSESCVELDIYIGNIHESSELIRKSK